jgi:hypothetical protein
VPPFEGGPCVFPPAGNGRLVALPRPPCGLLPAPPQRLQQTADMAGMIPDTPRQVDDCGNPSAGPKLSSKPVGFGTALQELGQAGEVLASEPTGCAGWGSVAEGIWPTLAGAFHPLADRPFADAQGLGDLALRPAVLLELPGLETSGLFPVGGCAVHAESVSHHLHWFSFLCTGL